MAEPQIDANDVVNVYSEQLARAQRELALNAAMAAKLTRDNENLQKQVAELEKALAAQKPAAETEGKK